MSYPRVICPRCKGTKYMLGQEGKVPNYRHNEKGLCFACDGEGTLLKRPDGKLVRRDLNTGKWLSYDSIRGSFLGTVYPLKDVDYLMNKYSTKVEKTYEEKLEEEYLEFIESLQDYSIEQMMYSNNTFVSISELEDMCNLPEGVGLFDDDR